MTPSRRDTVAADLNDLIRTVRRGDDSDVQAAPTIAREPVAAEPIGESATGDSISNGTANRANGVTSSRAVPALERATSDVAARPKKPVGKRSHPDYQLTGLYLRRSTTTAVKQALLASEQDMSELMEDLLTKWLDTRGARPSVSVAGLDR